MELKTSPDGVSKSLFSDEEILCYNCRNKITFGNSVWICSKSSVVTCRKCTFSKSYSCPANSEIVRFHEDIKAILLKTPIKKVEE